MMGLISEDMKISLENIVAHCFYGNRILDRICSLLAVDFVMPNTGGILHTQLAHKYPLLADDVTNYMESRDCSAIYGETPRGDKIYESPLVCFNEILEINLKLESLIKDSIKLSLDENDYTTKIFLESFLLKILPITGDALTLVDKAERYGESDMSWMRFDSHIKGFGIFQDKVED